MALKGARAKLTEDDLPDLVKVLHEVREKWEVISKHLELSNDEIDSVSKDCDNNLEVCLRKSLLIWLKRGTVPTMEVLAKALQLAGENDLSKEILSEKNLSGAKILSKKSSVEAKTPVVKYMFHFTVFFLVLSVVLYMYTVDVPNRCSVSLPGLTQKLIGRENEVSAIMDYLTDSEVETVGLFGLPGVGKSELAVHIGHNLLEMGHDVYFIRVEDFTDVESVAEELMLISGMAFQKSNYRHNLERWARSIVVRTLLILDNVDGPYWVAVHPRMSLQRNFLDILSRHSDLLTILITSQQEFCEGCRYYQLFPLSLKDCASLLHLEAHSDLTLSASDSEICQALNYMPIAIKVFASIGKEGNVKDLSQVSSHIKADKIFHALNLSFALINPECQIYSFLLSKFQGSFSVDDAEQLVTANARNHLALCLDELLNKCFIERRLTEHQNVYSFHMLVRDFLKLSRDQLSDNITVFLPEFWHNYFVWLRADYTNRVDRPIDAYQEDVEIFKDLLLRNNSYSYNLALAMADYNSVLSMLFSWDVPDFSTVTEYESLDDLFSLVTNTLISDCDTPGLTHEAVKISDVISAYVALFTKRHFVKKYIDNLIIMERAPDERGDNEAEILDTILKCELKIERLRSLAKGDDSVLFPSSHFHNYLVDESCLLYYNQHGGCSHRWKYRILDLCNDFKVYRRSVCGVEDDCQLFDSGRVETVMKGVCHYSLMEDDDAISLLKLALKSNHSTGSDLGFEALLDSIAHITLYDIFSKRGDVAVADNSKDYILNMYTRSTNISCFSLTYGYIAIPFLRSMDDELASKMCGFWVDSYTAPKCDDSKFVIYHLKTGTKMLAYSSCGSRFNNNYR